MNDEAAAAADTILRQWAGSADLDLDAPTREKLLDLGRHVLEKRRTVNLTGARDLATLVKDHVIDSLALVGVIRYLDLIETLERPFLVDVGSGGGFPALPLAIALDGLQVLCIESVGKKARALKDLADAAAPGRVTVVNDRAERVARDQAWRETADLATARAVGRLATVCELTLPFLRLDGFLLAQKGRDLPAEEVDEARGAMERLGGRLERVANWPGHKVGRLHRMLLIRKVAHTPPEFPRRPGIPAKRPLGKGKQ